MLAVTLICLGLLAPAPLELEKILILLREQPTNDALIHKATTWALERGGVERVAQQLEKQGREQASAVDLHLAGRFWEEGGRPAHAFLAYEAALKLPRPLPETRFRLTKLLLRGYWPERAREVWFSGARPQISKEEQLYLDFRFALVGEGGESEARQRLLSISALPIPAKIRAGWAADANLVETAVQLYRQAGQNLEAFKLLLHSGAWQQARKLLGEERLTLDDESALLLSRAFGEEGVLETHLTGRDDPAAKRLRSTLSSSLGGGSTETAPRPSRSPPPKGQQAPSPHEPDDPSPHLARVLSLLNQGFLEEARRELTRWRLEPRESDRQRWLPILQRRVPEWFPDERLRPELIPEIVHQAEAWQHPEEAWQHQEAQHLNTLRSALTSVRAGSEAEAGLLYHLGRLTHSEEKLRRAHAIAPQLEVAQRRSGLRFVQTLSSVLAEEPWPGAIPLPDPIDLPLGHEEGRPLRISRTPLPSRRDWHLVEWREATERPFHGRSVALRGTRCPIDPRSGLLLFPEGALAVGRGLSRSRDDPWHERVRSES
ncbi:MAG: hypothetical protein V3T77_00400, partial [Planctomycetota bacterium]